MAAALTQDQQLIRDLFDNEVEGRLVDPKRIHELFMDDAANEQMDRMLQEEKPGFWTRFFRKFVG